MTDPDVSKCPTCGMPGQPYFAIGDAAGIRSHGRFRCPAGHDWEERPHLRVERGGAADEPPPRDPEEKRADGRQTYREWSELRFMVSHDRDKVCIWTRGQDGLMLGLTAIETDRFIQRLTESATPC
jgi:hypothetical protein